MLQCPAKARGKSCPPRPSSTLTSCRPGPTGPREKPCPKDEGFTQPPGAPGAPRLFPRFCTGAGRNVSYNLVPSHAGHECNCRGPPRNNTNGECCPQNHRLNSLGAQMRLWNFLLKSDSVVKRPGARAPQRHCWQPAVHPLGSGRAGKGRCGGRSALLLAWGGM